MCPPRSAITKFCAGAWNPSVAAQPSLTVRARARSRNTRIASETSVTVQRRETQRPAVRSIGPRCVSYTVSVSTTRPPLPRMASMRWRSGCQAPSSRYWVGCSESLTVSMK